MGEFNLRLRFDLGADVTRGLEAAALRELRPVMGQIGQEMVDHAGDLSRERYHTGRPDSRRNAARGGEHYDERWKATVDQASSGRARVAVVNDHPVAMLLEHGNPGGYEIAGPGSFPLEAFKGGDYGADGGERFFYGDPFPSVTHPGSEGQHVGRDTLQWAREQRPQIKVRVRISLKR